MVQCKSMTRVLISSHQSSLMPLLTDSHLQPRQCHTHTLMLAAMAPLLAIVTQPAGNPIAVYGVLISEEEEKEEWGGDSARNFTGGSACFQSSSTSLQTYRYLASVLYVWYSTSPQLVPRLPSAERHTPPILTKKPVATFQAQIILFTPHQRDRGKRRGISVTENLGVWAFLLSVRFLGSFSYPLQYGHSIQVHSSHNAKVKRASTTLLMPSSSD